MNTPVASVRGLAPPAALACAIACWAVATSAAQNGSQPGAKTPSQGEASSSTGAPSPERRKYTTETVRGRVAWLEDALQRGFGITTVPDAAHSTVVLETAGRRLWPIVPDTRGRAFAIDERLRDIELEMLVRRYADVPMIQIIRVYRPRGEKLYEIDYWCDICAIPMVNLKPCECCGGPIRLRERLVKNGSKGG